MATPPSNQQLFDAFLLGMTWLREDRPNILARPGSSIFSALSLAGVISEGQRRILAGNAGLVTLAMQNGDIIKGTRRPPKSQLEARIAGSRKHLIILVTDPMMQYGKMFGARGYQHVITAEGMEYAHSVASQYSALLDEAKFRRAWEVFKTRMRAKNAKNPQSRSRPMGDTVSGSSEPSVRISREAPYREEDFEW